MLLLAFSAAPPTYLDLVFAPVVGALAAVFCVIINKGAGKKKYDPGLSFVVVTILSVAVISLRMCAGQ